MVKTPETTEKENIRPDVASAILENWALCGVYGLMDPWKAQTKLFIGNPRWDRLPPFIRSEITLKGLMIKRPQKLPDDIIQFLGIILTKYLDDPKRPVEEVEFLISGKPPIKLKPSPRVIPFPEIKQPKSRIGDIAHWVSVKLNAMFRI